MDKMKRFKKGVLDGFRSSAAAPKSELEIEESLRAEHFQVCKTVRHGFPFQPTSVAYDPVQHILAIGTKTGSLRIFGRPGVDCHCCHTEEVAVIQILFLVNEGALVTVCSDDTLHLWNYRQKRPEIVHTLKFLKERITYCHLPFQSKWLYAGTERGNVHVVNIESFFLSGYVINWNKAIELSRKTHPGPVVHLSDNPLDPNRLLIGFESGTVVLWDLKSKTAEYRYSTPEALRSISWYHDGKQFMCSHSDGSLTTWNCKTPLKPMNVLLPHAKIGKDGKPDPCKPITKVEWKSVRNGEPLVIFSGGMSYDKAGRTPSITVMNGKSTTVLEMEHNVVDFVVLCETPWVNEFQEPYAIVVLLQNDLVVVDLTVQGYPCFENPYPMDIHESPVTACQYYADCPPELIPAFYSVGSKQKKSGFSEKGWPIKGGEWGTTTCSYPEIIVTGHADGSLKFWDASAVTLQVLYKVKTAKIFEKPKCKNSDGQDEDPFAIQIIRLCPESRVLCVAGGTHVMLFLFSKQEITLEVPSMEIQIIYEVYDDLESPDYEYPKPTLGAVHQKSESFGSYSSSASDSTKETYTALKVKSGQRRWSPGYHPELVCLLSYIDSEHPGNITSISVNSTYGLIAFGNESGLAIVDYSQKSCLLNLGTPDLYGSMDPYQRAPRSPRGKRPQPQEAANTAPYTEECKSPTSDQPLSQQSPTSPSVVYQSKKRSSLTEPGLVAIDETDTCLPHDINDNNNTKTLAQRTSVKSALHMSKENLLGHKTLRKMSAVDSQEFNSKLPTFRSKSDAFTKKNLKKILRRSSSDTELETVTKEKTCDNQTEPKSAEILNVVSSPVICDCNSKNNNMLLSSPNENNNFKVGLRLVSGTDSKTLACYRQSETVDGIGKSLFRKMSLTIKSITTKVRGYGFGDEEHESNRARSRRRFGDVGKVDVVDLTDDYRKPSVKRHVSRSEIFHGMLIDKNDGSSFSRSRSSSMSSLENVSKEAIQRLLFADSYTRKTDNSTCPCLWVGTSLGSVLVIVLSLPPNGDQRLNQPVIVSPSGTIFRLKGSILNMSFLDCNGVLIPTVSEQWKDTSKDNKEDKRESQRPRQTSTSNYKPKISPTTSTEMSDRQFAIICSEKQARVMSLPSQTCAYKVKITETSFVVCSDIVSIKDSVCLVCYVANGHIMTFSLPSLKLLMDALFQPLTNIRVARTFCFSNNGHALYLCSPTEVQKITYSAEFSENLNEMLGDLFLPCDTPEAPKQSFFKNLFSGGGSTVDREELFGETSGKASKGLARVIAGSGGMQHLTAQSGSVAGEVARTRQALFERGEKLEGLDEKTAMMATEAESYAQVAHQIMLKYKDKKWYQF